jgi:hypothetical protein
LTIHLILSHIFQNKLFQSQFLFDFDKKKLSSKAPLSYIYIGIHPWSWSYGSWIYNYLCNQCLSPITMWVRGVLDTTLCNKVCQWLATGCWFSPGTPVSSINKTEPSWYNWNCVESGIKHHNSNSSIKTNRFYLSADSFI